VREGEEEGTRHTKPLFVDGHPLRLPVVGKKTDNPEVKN
jgi:hypothetical protein